MVNQLILLTGLHFVFDWFQPRFIQNSKNEDIWTLTLHVFFATVFPAILFMTVVWSWDPYFVLINFASHFVIDDISSNIAAKYKKLGNEYGLIVTTAIDCFLHLVIWFKSAQTLL